MLTFYISTFSMEGGTMYLDKLNGKVFNLVLIGVAVLAFFALLTNNALNSRHGEFKAHCGICNKTYKGEQVKNIVAIDQMRDYLGEPFRLPVCKKCLANIKNKSIGDIVKANKTLIKENERMFVNYVIIFQRYKEGNKELVLVKDELPILGKN